MYYIKMVERKADEAHWIGKMGVIRNHFIMVIYLSLPQTHSSQVAQYKESTCQCWRLRRFEFDPWVRKIPWRRKWQPTPVFLSEKSHGQTSLWATVQSSQRAGDPTEHSQCIYHHTLENTNTNVWERINSSPLSERFNTWDWKEKPLCIPRTTAI